MRKYNRLSLEEREEISRMLAQKRSIRAIAAQIGRSPSTISREVRKGYGDKYKWRYRAFRAHKRALRNAKKRHRGHYKLGKNKKLFTEIEEKLHLRWSPDQIAQWLKRTYANSTMHVSAETIYTYLYVLSRGSLKKELITCLRQQHKRRYKKGNKYKSQTANFEDMLSIEERPKEVAERCIPGHWEGDMIIGGRTAQTALGTLVERTTRYVILVPLKNKKAEHVRKAYAREIKKLPASLRLSMTYDQGREMSEHKLFTKETKMKVYFAHPSSPWERGTNENTNGLIRQFFPKGTNFKEVSRYKIKKVQDMLNGRPRRSLGYETPYEAMEKLLR